MTEERLDREEEVQETSPAQGSDSDEASLDDLFEDDSDESQDSSGESKDDKIERLEKMVASLEKGFKKAFSEKGQQPKERVEIKDSPSSSSVLKNLYMKANPEAQEVWEDVEREAKLLGKDPFELYEASSYFKGEAKARIEAKKVEEESRRKIERPSSDTGSPKTDISKVKEEDVEKLKPSEKLAWLKAQAAKEKNRID